MLPLAKNLVKPYQKLLDRIPNPAWIVDTSGRVGAINAAWLEAGGRSPSTAKPLFFFDLVAPTEREEIKRQWQEFCESTTLAWQSRQHLDCVAGDGNLYDLEAELLDNSDNSSSLWLITAIPAKPIGLLSDSELADYKQKERQLERNVEFVRRIMESSQDCIKVLDLEGRLLYMNDGGQDIMEIDDFTAVQNAPWLSFWTGCDRQSAEQAFAQALAGETGRFDGYCSTAKGTPKWWEVVVTPMFDTKHQVQEILSVSRDITVRKTAQLALQKRNQELDRYTYMVTHDLKAPLRGIANLSSWIIEDLGDRLPPENEKQLQLLKQRVQRMTALIDGLLKISKIGRQKLTQEQLDLVELLDEAIDSLSPNPNFKIAYAKSLPQIAAKRILLIQVLCNLIDNAIKHHDRERGQIEVTVEEADTHYQFAIADDGPGIVESERERIFEIFQTLENNTSSTNTGIGLALVKKIIEEEGGQLWLEENTPRGCKFKFTWQKTVAA